MQMLNRITFLALVLASSGCLGLADHIIEEEDQQLSEPFISSNHELFRFSRSVVRSGPAAKYRENQQRRQEQQVQQQPQAQPLQQEFNVQNEADQLQQQPAPEVAHVKQPQSPPQQVVAGELPSFAAVDNSKTINNEQVVQSPSKSVPADNGGGDFAVAGFDASKSSQSSSSSQASSSKKQSALTKTIKTTTTTTTVTQNNQDQPQVARLQEIRIHTVPLSEAVHYANYMVIPQPAAASASSSAAKLEESSDSSSSSSSSSSSHKSSSTREETTSEVIPPPPPAATTVVLPPVSAPVGPDCVLHRLIVERPVSSQVVIQAPQEVKVSSSSQHSSLHSKSSRITQNVEQPPPPPPTIVAPTCCVVKKPAPAGRLVAAQAPQGSGSNEEHSELHSETHSSRQEERGPGHASLTSSASSSTSTSRRSKSSSSSSSSTTTQHAAPLVAAPPVVIHQQPVVVHRSAPLVTQTVVRPQSQQHTNSYVNVDHHYNSPNVKYGYSIKQSQQSSEPDTKGLVVGERVVYLK